MMTKLICAAGVFAALGSTACFAADAPKPLSPASQMLVERMKQADANHDGSVTKDEWVSFLKGRFATFDTNHDGKLSSDEVTAMLASQPQMSGMTAADVTAAYDKDGDGFIGEDEYVERASSRFDAWDLNHDHSISPEEQKAEIDRMETTPPK